MSEMESKVLETTGVVDELVVREGEREKEGGEKKEKEKTNERLRKVKGGEREENKGVSCRT